MPRAARFALSEIQQEALAIVDRDGLAALTMRSLAAALGTGPMTLYNYLDGRGGLDELVVDAVAALVPATPPGEHWIDDVRRSATALWSTVRRHPGVIPLVLTRRTSSPASLVPAEALAAALARSGRSGFELLVAFRAVMGVVMGIAQAELAGPLGPERDATAAAERFGAVAGELNPTLAALAGVAGQDPQREFDAGLDIVLAGLASGGEALGGYDRSPPP